MQYKLIVRASRRGRLYNMQSNTSQNSGLHAIHHGPTRILWTPFGNDIAKKKLVYTGQEGKLATWHGLIPPGNLGPEHRTHSTLSPPPLCISFKSKPVRGEEGSTLNH